MSWRRVVARVLIGFAAAVCIGLLLTAGIWFSWQHRAQPAPTRRALFRGVTYRRDVWTSPRPVVLHLLTVDLQTPGLRFGVTPGDRTRALPLVARTTSAYLKEAGAQAAINADFFYPWVSHAPWDYYPHVGDPVAVEGRACNQGACYGGGAKRAGKPSLFLSRDNRAVIVVKAPAGPLYNVVSGNEVILQDGKVTARPSRDLHPRTAVGLDKRRRRLFLIIVDGRQPNYSEGVTTPELAEILRDCGAATALNLDGGGSTTLAVQGAQGEPQVLNSPIDNRIPGRERPVANHLAVFAPPL